MCADAKVKNKDGEKEGHGMTYLDLLTELQNLPEKELIKDVQLYDLDCEEYLPAFSFRYHKQTPTIEI